jgi:predicted alpha/beta superfamily hydrolase
VYNLAMPPYTLPGTELHELVARETGRAYLLHLAVPAPRHREPGRRLATVYMVDPQWDFGLVAATLGNLAFDRAVPQCMVVAVGYPGQHDDYEPLRHRDLSPVKVNELAGEPDQGQAARFLAFLADEVIPWAERERGADPSCRVLLGSSLGGLFGLYALLERPGLFQGVVAASPAAGWGGDWVRELAERVSAAGTPLDARLFMSGAEDEWPGFLAGVRRMDETLRARPFPGLAYRWRLVDGERHSGTKAEAFTRGLRFVLAPWAPEPGRLER